MCSNATETQERIATESPREAQTCDVCGECDTNVYTYGDQDEQLPVYDAHASCSYNPVAQSREDFVEALHR